MSHVRQKLKTAQKNLGNAQEVYKKHKETIKALSKDLLDLELRRTQFEEEILSQSQGGDVELERSQV